MKDANLLVFFDHYLSSALGEWFATPDGFLSFPLPYEVFFNLITSGPIVCSRQDFFFYARREDPTFEKSPRYKELKELIDIGKIILVDLERYDVFRLEKDVKYKRILTKARKMQAQVGLINRQRSSTVTNVCNLAYCHAKNLPMRFSKETIEPTMRIVTEFTKEGVLPNEYPKIDPGGLNEILKWIFEVEVPFISNSRWHNNILI